MAKRSIKLASSVASKKGLKGRVKQPGRLSTPRLAKSQMKARPTTLGANVELARPRDQGSEDLALSTLVSSIADKLGDQGLGQVQMMEFLNLVLETDPALREDILNGLQRK